MGSEAAVLVGGNDVYIDNQDRLTTSRRSMSPTIRPVAWSRLSTWSKSSSRPIGRLGQASHEAVPRLSLSGWGSGVEREPTAWWSERVAAAVVQGAMSLLLPLVQRRAY